MGLILLPFAVVPWVVFCAAAGVVAVAAINGPVSYGKSALIGAVIGIVCGLVRIYGIRLGDLPDPQSPAYVSGLITGLVSIMITTGFAAATGAAVPDLWRSPREMYAIAP